MRVINQTESELVIHSFVDRKKLLLPGAFLGLAIAAIAIAFATGFLNGAVVFICLLVGGLAASTLYGKLKSETLTLDRAADQIRCDRKTLFGSQQWQLPLSALQDVSITDFKRRYKKIDGNQGTLWFYTLKFVAQDALPQTLLYSPDGDRVKAAYQAIHEFWGAAAQQSPTSVNRPRGRGLGLVVSKAYEQWREATWAIQPEQAGGSRDEGDRVYGVLMDIGMLEEATSEPWAISISAFSSGDASFYPTPGGGLDGLGDEPRVAEAARTIIELAQTILPKAYPLEDDALPDQPDLVQFALLTPGGVYSLAETLKRLQTPDKPLGQMLGQFNLIRQFAEQTLDQR